MLTKFRGVKGFLSVLLLVFVAVGCATFGRGVSHRGPASVVDPETAKLREEVQQLQELVEEALVWRVKAVAFAEQVQKEAKQSGIHQKNLEYLHERFDAYMQFREKMLKLAQRYAWISDANTRVVFAPGKGTLVDPKPELQAESFQRITARIDPSDEEGRRILTQMKLSLAAALVLYDNYRIGVAPFQLSERLRYLINTDERGRRLQQVTESYTDLGRRQQTKEAIEHFDAHLKWRETHAQMPSREEEYLELLINQSDARQVIITGKDDLQIGVLQSIKGRFRDDMTLLKRALSHVSSMFFGNAVGLIEARKGRMYRLPKEERGEIDAAMEPLDVLLEKTPFRLTDKFIPGHYGHVAIWAGNEEQLKALGVWDHPTVAKHHGLIREGRRIIEALRPGVEINTLDHFLNIDDMLVLRHRELSLEEKREFIIKAFEQVGKEYDFNFDVDTKNRIVCSELAYRVFLNTTWPTDKALGRYTISPDHVVLKAVDGGPFTTVLMYHDGRKVTERHEEILTLFLKEDYEAAKAILPSPSRDPAALSDALQVLETADLKMYKDFFQFDSRGKRMRYQVKAKFWTDMNKEELGDRARSAFHVAIAKTLRAGEKSLRGEDSPAGTPPESLTARLKSNLVSAFLKEFVLTLEVLKIVDGTIQVDFFFLPEGDSPTDFGPELSTNGLIRLGDTGSLASRLKELDNWSVTRKVHAGRELAQVDTQELDYLGGVVSLNIKLLDTGWKPLRKLLPSTRKNAVKGFIRYRRYFAGKAAEGGASSCQQKDFRIESAGFGKAGPQFMTVDLYKTFNLEDFIPRAERLEVFPGRIVASNQGSVDFEDRFLPRGPNFVGKTIHTGDFVVSGSTGEGIHAVHFKQEIGSLAYSLKSGEFDSKASKAKSSGEYPGGIPPEGMSPAEEAWKAQGRMLKECKDYLVQSLSLSRMGLQGGRK